MNKQAGYSLLETVVAIAIMGSVVVAVLAGLTTTSRVAPITDEQNTAQNLAASQMEYVRVAPYSGIRYYETDPDLIVPSGYNITTEATSVNRDIDESDDDGIQLITVTVNRSDKTVITIESYKVSR